MVTILCPRGFEGVALEIVKSAESGENKLDIIIFVSLFFNVAQYLEENDDETITVNDLVERMQSSLRGLGVRHT